MLKLLVIFNTIQDMLVEAAGIEPATPNRLQLYDIIYYYYITKITNGTGVMGQVCLEIFIQNRP